MEQETDNKGVIRIPPARNSIIALFAGLLLGFAAHRWPTDIGTSAIEIVEPLGAMWLRALHMLVIPLMVSMLVVAIGGAGRAKMGQLGVTTMFCFAAFLAAATLLTAALGSAVLEWLPLSMETRAAFSVSASIASPQISLDVGVAPSIRDWFVNLVPGNLLEAAANGDLLPLLVGTVLFSVALHFAPAGSRRKILAGAGAISDWCTALAGLLFRLLPPAIFVLVLKSAAASGGEIGSGLVYYVFWVCALLILVTLLLYPITAHFGGIPAAKFARAARPVQLLAFSTRSSVACLPAMLAAAKKGLAIPKDVAGFVLPFSVSTFKLNMGISAIFQMFFLLHIYGIQPDPVALVVACAAVTAQSVATPGLPSGAIWTTTPVYLALGIPLEGIVLTNVVDTIPDLFKTTVNVTGNLSIATIVARRAR